MLITNLKENGNMGNEKLATINKKIKGKKRTELNQWIKKIKGYERKKMVFVFETDTIRGAARPRFSTIKTKSGGTYVHTYTIKKDKDYKETMRKFIRSKLADDFVPFNNVPLSVKIETFSKIPSNFSLIKQWLAEKKYLRPGKKPDVDNIAKLPLDVLGGGKVSLLFSDDVFVVDLHVRKWYSMVPRMEITVWYDLPYDTM